MPSQSTYPSPGQYGFSRTVGTGLMTLGLHTQMTLVAPSSWKRSWMCRHALTKVAAVVSLVPHGYQWPFISCAKLIATGTAVLRTLSRTPDVRVLEPSAISPRPVLNGSQETYGSPRRRTRSSRPRR